MATYSQQELEGMSLLDIRKVARGLGITDLVGKRPQEIVRMVLTKQKPGGVDPRVKPKAAAAAKSALGKSPPPTPAREKPVATPAVKRGPVAVKHHAEIVDDDPLGVEEAAPRGMPGTLEQRVARIEAALIGAGVLSNSPAKKPGGRAPKSVEQAVLPSEWFDKDGNLQLTPEDIESMNFDTICSVNDLLGENKANIGPELQKSVRLARMRLVQALRKMGTVEQPVEDEAPAEEGEEIDPAEWKAPEEKANEFPPESVGDWCYIKDEGGEWHEGKVTKIEDKKGSPWFTIGYLAGDDVMEEEVDADELSPIWE